MATARSETDFLDRARESLDGAESELANKRYNNATNRAYYACFQAAVYVLMKRAYRQPRNGQWSHTFVQGEFARLIRRQKLFPSSLRDALSQLLFLRVQADYRKTSVSEIQAHRGVRRAREFMDAIEEMEKTT
jgi:uncharacterized protein (UPF0332 family)